MVAAASYEARKFGVHSAMPSRTAYKLCPHGVFVRPNMQKYGEVSRQIMTILETFTPQIQQLSVDEAFLDVTRLAWLVWRRADDCQADQDRDSCADGIDGIGRGCAEQVSREVGVGFEQARMG